ncbi:MAG: hypothetical protein JSV99_09850, partial [Planctomycetota bacterium]
YGSPAWTSGRVAAALAFDGVDDYVDVGDPADGSLDFGSGSFTIGLWFKTTAPSGELVDKSGGGGGRGLGYSLYMGPVEMGAGEDYAEVGALSLRVRENPPGDVDRIETINTYNDGGWHYLAAVRAGSGAANLKIYVDGAEVTTFNPKDEGAGDISNQYGLSIGAKFDAGDSDAWEDFFDGAIDEVGIWDRALDANEIERLYEDGLAGRGITLGPLFADANGGDYHLLSERGRYWPAEDVWVLDDVTSPGVDGGDPAVEPSAEPMPNGARVNMGAYGGTAYASMSEWPMAGDMDEDGIVNMADYAILADSWLEKEEWFNEAPQVYITDPPDGFEFYWLTETVLIVADAWDGDGSVVKVEFFANGGKIGQDNDGGDGWQIALSFDVGTYVLTAKATDDDGATDMSPPVTITATE